MASDFEKRAKDAFLDDDIDLAIDLYSQAIEIEPNNADLYADRAQANIKLENFTEAVADSNKAIELDPSMSKAYFRKGTACMKLEEYQTAIGALEAGSSLAVGDKRFTKLIEECREHIAEENVDLPKQVLKTDSSNRVIDSLKVGAQDTNESGSECGTQHQAPSLVPSRPKYRHDFYNTTTEVVVTIFAKSIPAEYVNIQFGEQAIDVSIDIPEEDTYHLRQRLFGKIVPEKCKYEVLSSKIEIRLTKAETMTWTSLDFKKDKALPQKVHMPEVKSQRPSYPSSKSKVDWDKLESQVKKEEKDEKLEGDAALNKFFKDIYGDADDDMRRAMMKSFVESNGTVLSTDWKDIGARKVESTPPDGMELKKW